MRLGLRGLCCGTGVGHGIVGGNGVRRRWGRLVHQHLNLVAERPKAVPNLHEVVRGSLIGLLVLVMGRLWVIGGGGAGPRGKGRRQWLGAVGKVGRQLKGVLRFVR